MSVSKMAKKNALCKNLTIVETIGNVDVVCSDKTGTLTLNKMTVVSINDYEDIINKHDKSVEEIKMNLPRYKHIVSIGMFCNNAEMDTNNPDNFFGDPTEAALLVLGNKTELSVEKTRNKYKRVYEQPFDSDRKRMTTVYKTKHGYTSFTKGAAESIIELCTHIDTDNGPREITNEDKKLIKDYLNYLSSKALRVLGFASTNFIDAPTKDSNYEQAMTFKGLVGMIDPPREEVYDAVKTCHEAGVQVSMITGDHQITALAIAHQLGIVPLDDQTTMTGVEIDALSDEFLREKVKGCHVYARVSPDNKLRIVQAYKDNGMIAAMTGDGTNDAPALKTADIGIAMGKTGTDVAKGAASILLLDDNFTTIKTAINDGRKITRNIRNVISFILSTNLGTALFIFLFTYLFTLNPLIVTQRLLLDLVTDTMPCIFIGLNPNDFGLMRVKQRKTDKLFDKTMFREIFINTMAIFISTTIVFLTAYLAIGFGGIGNPKDGVKFKALDCLCFITLSLSRILLSLSYISKSKSIFSKEGRPYSGMYVAISISIVLLFLFTFIPGLNKIVETPSSSE
jgi:Ca2+-transporting ATPase